MAGENSGGRTVSGGTVYSMQEGRTVSGGTVYAVKEGRTIAGGTVYSIVMGEKTYTVTITGTGSGTNCYVIIDGNKYTSAAEITGLPEGTAIDCYALKSAISKIYLNGEAVASGKPAQYTYQLIGNTEFSLQITGPSAKIYITEEGAA